MAAQLGVVNEVEGTLAVAGPDGIDSSAAACFGVLDVAPEPDDFFKQCAQFFDLRIGHEHLLLRVAFSFRIERGGTDLAQF